MVSENDPKHLAAVQDLQGVIHHYLSLQAMAAIFLLAAVFIYFPARPPSPPPGTTAAAANKEAAGESKGWGPVTLSYIVYYDTLIMFFFSFLKVLSDPQLWLVCFANAVPGGMLTTWQSLMGLNFGPLGVTDAEIGRIGFISLFVQAVTASALAFVQDKLPRYLIEKLI